MSYLLSSKADLTAFDADLDTFFKATGMAENHSKRDYIALGNARKVNTATLPGKLVTDPVTGEVTNTSCVLPFIEK